MIHWGEYKDGKEMATLEDGFSLIHAYSLNNDVLNLYRLTYKKNGCQYYVVAQYAKPLSEDQIYERIIEPGKLMIAKMIKEDEVNDRRRWR